MPSSRYFASGGQWRTLTGAAFNTTPPSPPFITNTNYANNQLTVTVSPPLSNGGSAITSYTVQATPNAGGVMQQASGAGPTIVLQSLLAGASYTLKAFATNAAGSGGLSAGQVFAVPAASFVKPLSFNTGYPHGLSGDTRTPVTLTPVTGSAFETLIQATAGDATLSDYDVTGGFNLRRNNMTFQNCRFQGEPGTTGDAGFPYIAAGGSPQPTEVTFIDCEFAGNGVPQMSPSGNFNLGWAHSLPCNINGQTHIRSDIWGFMDGFHAMDNTRYESCYIHDLTFFYSSPTDSTHNDGFQFVGDASDFAVIGCNIDVAAEGVNAVWQYNGGVLRERITITNNWFNGGGYYMMSGAPAPNETIGMLFADNRFGLDAGSSAIWYPSSTWRENIDAGEITMTNNVWDVSGTTSYGVAVTAGSPIPEPN